MFVKITKAGRAALAAYDADANIRGYITARQAEFDAQAAHGPVDFMEYEVRRLINVPLAELRGEIDIALAKLRSDAHQVNKVPKDQKTKHEPKPAGMSYTAAIRAQEAYFAGIDKQESALRLVEKVANNLKARRLEREANQLAKDRAAAKIYLTYGDGQYFPCAQLQVAWAEKRRAVDICNTGVGTARYALAVPDADGKAGRVLYPEVAETPTTPSVYYRELASDKYAIHVVQLEQFSFDQRCQIVESWNHTAQRNDLGHYCLAIPDGDGMGTVVYPMTEEKPITATIPMSGEVKYYPSRDAGVTNIKDSGSSYYYSEVLNDGLGNWHSATEGCLINASGDGPNSTKCETLEVKHPAATPDARLVSDELIARWKEVSGETHPNWVGTANNVIRELLADCDARIEQKAKDDAALNRVSESRDKWFSRCLDETEAAKAAIAERDTLKAELEGLNRLVAEATGVYAPDNPTDMKFALSAINSFRIDQHMLKAAHTKVCGWYDGLRVQHEELQRVSCGQMQELAELKKPDPWRELAAQMASMGIEVADARVAIMSYKGEKEYDEAKDIITQAAHEIRKQREKPAKPLPGAGDK